MSDKIGLSELPTATHRLFGGKECCQTGNVHPWNTLVVGVLIPTMGVGEVQNADKGFQQFHCRSQWMVLDFGGAISFIHRRSWIRFALGLLKNPKLDNDSTLSKSSPKRSLIKSVVKKLPIPQSSSSSTSSLLSTSSSKRSASVKRAENIPNPDQPSYELPPIKNAPLYKKRYQSQNQVKQTTSHSITAQSESINRLALTNSTLDSWNKKKNGVNSLSNKRNPLNKEAPINLVCHSNYAGNADGFQRAEGDDNGDKDGVNLRLNTSHTLKKLSK
ncbi:unnamed protein product [Trichobilharzia regenti]|nr:unnamed protein product [Trichobilharzia regenti]